MRQMYKTMSKIVLLVGSVRRNGNTELLAKAFADGAGKRHEVKVVSVADYRIHPCKGCNCCYAREGNQCIQNDDTADNASELCEELRKEICPVYGG